MLWVHSQHYVHMLRLGQHHPSIANLFQEMEQWVQVRSPPSRVGKQLSLLAWSNIPQDHWPLPVMSSVAYSRFTKNLSATGLQGMELSQVPLWHSPVFTREVKSRIREMRERSFCCPRLVRRGIHILQDFVTQDGTFGRTSSLLCRAPSGFHTPEKSPPFFTISPLFVRPVPPPGGGQS